MMFVVFFLLRRYDEEQCQGKIVYQNNRLSYQFGQLKLVVSYYSTYSLFYLLIFFISLFYILKLVTSNRRRGRLQWQYDSGSEPVG